MTCRGGNLRAYLVLLVRLACGGKCQARNSGVGCRKHLPLLTSFQSADMHEYVKVRQSLRRRTACVASGGALPEAAQREIGAGQGQDQ